jgi:SAM-dependent methyltransferase
LSTLAHISNEHYENGKMHGEDELPIMTWLHETDRDDTRRYEMFKSKMTNRSVLDFGCGCGGFLLKARNVATEVAGLELERRLQPWFQSQNLHVWPSIEVLQQQPATKFDLITSFHVFEHLSDPRAMLTQLSEFLADDGEIIVEVPSANDALLTLYNCEPFTQFTYWSQHLFLFNPFTICELVKQSGLKLNWQKNIQRYSLSNHLYWLSRGKSGGHAKWSFFDDVRLDELYANQLAEISKTDTVMVSIRKNDQK